MPAHDWTRVDAGTFHAFHSAWVTHLSERLNGGILPDGYYAMGEQIASKKHPDVLTLRVPRPNGNQDRGVSGTMTLDAAPRVKWRIVPKLNQSYHRKKRSVVIRHVSGHEVVAFIEIVSRANKDRTAHIEDIVNKITQALEAEISVMMIDLLPPTKHDLNGMHGAIWDRYDDEAYQPPAEQPLTLASYVWEEIGPEAFVEPLGVGKNLIEMPLFLTKTNYVNVPLEETYMQAYRGMPRYWRDVVEGKSTPST